MFGYVRPLQSELKVKEYEIYKAVYCGLCKELKRRYGFSASFVLSYDFSFLALLQMGLAQHPAFHFDRERCPFHPTARRGVCASNEGLAFAAGMSCLTFYHKVADNRADGRFFQRAGSALLLPFAARLHRKAAREYPEQAQEIAGLMARQGQLEASHCPRPDEAAEPTALTLSSLCKALGEDERSQRVLSRFGYFLGRWVYLCDALDDLQEDAAQGSYNPYLTRRGLMASPTPQELGELRQEAAGSLNLTLAELEKTYDLLTIRQFRPILDNIVSLGLRSVQLRILSGKQKKQEPEAI